MTHIQHAPWRQPRAQQSLIYNKDKVPGDLPLTLKIRGFDIRDIAEVNVNEGFITIFVELFVNWEDRKIAYKPDQRLVDYFAVTIL